MRSELVVAIALAVASCSEPKAGSPPAKDQAPVTFVPSDAGAAATTIAPGTEPRADEVPAARPVTPPPPSDRERKPIDVTLRSTPTGARVAVDGTVIGVTPLFWSGYADGREHEFTFTLPRHAVARYRFVPVSSGVIHARLDPMVEERDAGVGPAPQPPHPPEVVPQPPPASAEPKPPAPIDPAPHVPQGSASTPQGSASAGSGLGPQP